MLGIPTLATDLFSRSLRFLRCLISPARAATLLHSPTPGQRSLAIIFMSQSNYISQLPPEILGEILTYCTAFNADSPAQLATISGYFHRVISLTPHVWQRLTLSLFAHSEEAYRRKVHLWFLRAATCNLHLDVDLRPSITNGDVPQGETLADPMTQLRLPHMLRPYSSRIGSLQLDGMSEHDAQSFISSVYPPQHDGVHMSLESLVVRINPDSPPVSIIQSAISPPYSQLTLPRLSHLSCLHLVNHTLPDPSKFDLSTLRSLVISRPIRASPFQLQAIVHILRTTPSIAHLEIYGRITDIVAPLSPAGEGAGQDEDPLAPLTLPCLTHLSLRSNHIPQILSALIMPELRALRLDDLDGRRKNASEETSTALRQLLVRMDLPRETRRGNGLKVLDLGSISIRRQRGKQTHLWEWCFKRMWLLEEIRVKNMDVNDLADILIPSKYHHEAGDTPSQDETVCPRLRSLSIVNNQPSHLVAQFRCLRPSVDLKYEITDDVLSHPCIEPPGSVSPPAPSNASRGFGFGFPFDRRRNEGALKKFDKNY
ncbi:hypothetical protein P691DRAFT_807578 [Macrolepiota fuliginosa MF-IS2]|uniref:F-box domain-containing protein n=1 Tax=Macrolepiota fuliginosa MF-IS2 TaxID=1400762 RepID=A0A9P5X6X2_9AGAR|nr:hypothetical protein P691DRAFT_807578 [Macrolepiota fuliginosa MF-IS2]